MALPTRRELIAGAGTGAAVLALPRPEPAVAAPRPTGARPDVVHRGRALAVTPDGRRVVVAHAARRTVVITDRRTRRTREVTLAGQPLEVAISPNAILAAVTTAFWDHPGVELLSLDGERRHSRLDAGPAPHCCAFTTDREHLVVAGGEQDGTLRILRAPDFRVGRTIVLGRVPRGLVLDGQVAYVALQAEDAVVRVDLRRGVVTKRLAPAPLPDRLALSPDGRRLLVSHGGTSTQLSEVDLRTGRSRHLEAGGAVSAVAYARSGARLAALTERNAVVILAAGRKARRIGTVIGPRGLAVAGRHAFTVSATTGEIGRVRA